MKQLIFPGSFDPLTNGHLEIILKAKQICDELIIVITENTNKTPYIEIEDRLMLIKELTEDTGDIKVLSSKKMICEVVEDLQVYNIVRGLRDEKDFNFEMHMETYNTELNSKINTIFIITKNTNRHISSSGVREILNYNKDVSHLVPKNINEYLKGRK